MKNKELLLIPIALTGLFLISRRNKLNNPNIIKPAYHNTNTYFPTPSIVILEPNNYVGRLHYFCANHTYPFKNNSIEDSGGYSYAEKFEQPCHECLSESISNNINDNYRYINNQWVFNQGCTPINWNNPLSKIKDYNKLEKPTSHGFTVEDIDIKYIFKDGYITLRPSREFTYTQKNNNIIEYINKWYYKVPEYKTDNLNNHFLGIHYIIEQNP